MMPPGHLAASHIIASIGRPQLTTKEILVVLTYGLFPDLDIFLAPLVGFGIGNHHFLPSHTPLIVTMIWSFSYFFLKKYIRPLVLKLGLIAMLIHLLLDDLGYWLQLLKLQSESKIPQIFWFYPFDSRMLSVVQSSTQNTSALKALTVYFNLPWSVSLEILLVVTALAILFLNRSQKNQGK